MQLIWMILQLIPGQWPRDFLRIPAVLWMAIGILLLVGSETGRAAELKLKLQGNFSDVNLLLEVSLFPDRPGRFYLKITGEGAIVRSNPAQGYLESNGGEAVVRFPVEVPNGFRGRGQIHVIAYDESQQPHETGTLEFYRGTTESHLDSGLPRSLTTVMFRGMQHFIDEKTLPTGMPEGQALAMVRAMTAEAINTAEANLASDFRMNPLTGRMGAELRFAAAREAFQNEDVTGAVQLLREMTITRADQANLLAVALEKMGDRSAAIDTLRVYLRQHPDTVWMRCLNYNLGLLLKESGDTDAAGRCFQQVLEVNPNHHGARSELERLKITPQY